MVFAAMRIPCPRSRDPHTRRRVDSGALRGEIRGPPRCGLFADPDLTRSIDLLPARVPMTSKPADDTHPDPSPGTPAEVQVVLWDGVELLDFAGPGQVFACADEGRAFRVRTVAARPGRIRSQGFLTVEPEGVLGEGRPPRVLVVPGGASETAIADEQLIRAVGRVGRDAEVVLSVCTGALVLAAAGLLEDDMGATTWHGAIDRLRAAVPEVAVVEGPRWVDNGRVITAAGVSAGIDAALHLVERMLGARVMQETARYMEYSTGRFNADDEAGDHE